MVSSLKIPVRVIDWKKLKNYEIVTVWQPAFQAEVLKYIAELLAEGFQLLQIMIFLKQVYPKQQETFEAMANETASGYPFYEVVKHMKIEAMIKFPIQMAETMGEFSKTARNHCGLSRLLIGIEAKTTSDPDVSHFSIFDVIRITLWITHIFAAAIDTNAWSQWLCHFICTVVWIRASTAVITASIRCDQWDSTVDVYHQRTH